MLSDLRTHLSAHMIWLCARLEAVAVEGDEVAKLRQAIRCAESHEDFEVHAVSVGQRPR